MKRNRTIDIFRTIAILSVLIYHFYVLCNYPYQEHAVLNRMIGIGGELGVTLFFIISGFGIYNSLFRMEEKENKIVMKSFLKKRFLRILPQYYVCIAILLLITSNAQYMNKSGLFDIGTHLIFIHNWFPSTHGSINGVLWSMGTIFQFYFIAVFIYRLMKKNKWLVCAGAIAVTVAAKYVAFHLILPSVQAEPSWYFIYARQIITALDNFVLGMLLCEVLRKNPKEGKKPVYAAVSLLVLCMTVGWIWMTQNHSPYGDDLFGYLWHTVFAVLLTVLIYCVSRLEIRFEGFISRVLLWIARYQYGTYIWHFLIASTLLGYSSALQVISRSSFILFTILAGGICCIAGYASTLWFESVSYKGMWTEVKQIFSGRKNEEKI